MREITFGHVTMEVDDETFQKLEDSGAIIAGSDLDCYVLDEAHSFTAAEVRLLLQVDSD